MLIYRIKLYTTMVVIGVLAGVLFGGETVPHTNQDHTNQDKLMSRPHEITLEIAGSWASDFGFSYGLTGEPGARALELEPGIYLDWEVDEFVIVGLSNLSAKDCQVTCSSGNYACCKIDNSGRPVCRCRPNGQPQDGDCQSGGVGAVSCGITRGSEVEP